MALGFVIIAHKNPQQVRRVFSAIYRPQDVVVLHFDRRSPRELHDLGRDLVEKHENVILLPPRSIVWGGFQAAQVQLEAMKTALKANGRWHHFINLSGQDFSLKSIDALDEYLRQRQAYSFLNWFEPLNSNLWKNARERIDRYYLAEPWLDRILKVRGFGRRLRKLLGWQNRLPSLPLFHREEPPFRYYGGSNFVVLNRAACEYAVFDPRARHISRWLSHSLHSDEIFIQSILLNSPLRNHLVNRNLHEIDFPPGSPHPRIFEPRDLDKLLSSEQFFARKFDIEKFPVLMDQLEKRIR